MQDDENAGGDEMQKVRPPRSEARHAAQARQAVQARHAAQAHPGDMLMLWDMRLHGHGS